MATVITSIGANNSITTATPTSCAGGPGSYSVTFSSAPSGVSAGDKATFVDEASYYATFIYRVSAVVGSTLTLVFVSEDSEMVGDTSPCDLQDFSWSQAEAAFSRFYTTLDEWHEDLSNTEIYDSGDDAVGECHLDSTVFDESLSITGLGVLNSILLTVHPDSRHTGHPNTGARIVRTGSTANTPIVLGCDNLIVEWLAIDCTDATDISAAVEINSNALENVAVRNMLIHDVDPGDNVTDRAGIKVINSTADDVTRNILNNFIYNIHRSGVSSEDHNCVGIGEQSTGTSVDKGANLYNNTVRYVHTVRGTAYGYEVSPGTVVINNIAITCGNACFKVSDDTAGSASSSHNLSDDNTAADLGLQSPYDNYAQTADTGVTAVRTLVSHTDLHLRYIFGHPISLAVDRGTPLNAPAGILTDIDGDARVFGIPGVLARGYWDIGADESPYSHPFPVTADAVTVYTPPVIPAAAEFVLSAVDPTVTISYPSVTVTPSAAVVEFAGVSPGVTLGSVSLTPSASAVEFAALSPSVIIPEVVTPAAAVVEFAALSPSVIVPEVVTPAAAVVEFAGVSPGVTLGSVTLTPTASAVELSSVDPSVGLSSLTVSPGVSALELAGVSPGVTHGSITLPPSAASVEFAGISPGVTQDSVTVTPTTAAVELSSVDPSVGLSSLTVSPGVSALELAGVSPGVTQGSVTVTPTTAAVELSSVDPSVGLSSLTVSPGVSALELAGISPGVTQGSITLPPSAASVEFAGVSPGATLGSVSLTPAVAAVNYRARYAAVISGGITLIPVREAQVIYTASDPAVGMSSQSIAVTPSVFNISAADPTATHGSLSITPTVSVFAITADVPAIYVGPVFTPVAATFTLAASYSSIRTSGVIQFDTATFTAAGITGAIGIPHVIDARIEEADQAGTGVIDTPTADGPALQPTTTTSAIEKG